MSKSHDAKKDVKKKAAKTLKEKRLEKKAKKAGKLYIFSNHWTNGVIS